MRILHIRLGYFKVTLHVSIAFRARSSFKGIQTIQIGYFEVTIHVGIALKVDSSFNLVIPAFIFTSTNQNFGTSLQYLHPYLPLPTKIMGLCCNICTRTYLYQLEFWGLIAILALVLTSTNWDFGAQLQYMHLTLILSLSLWFCISNFLCLLLWKQ